jgi:hypothetical protein
LNSGCVRGAAYETQSAEMLLDAGGGRLRRLRVELFTEGELLRLANSALTGFFQDIQRHITEAMPISELNSTTSV